MRATQRRLFPDARPLVERLGREFFLELPKSPGVYLMRGGSGSVLYVGKAKNLRQRLGSYRVANSDHLPRRLLRLLHRVERVEIEICENETGALARERELLQRLRPPFNRAGVWPAPARHVAWRSITGGLEVRLCETPPDGWCRFGPVRGGAVVFRNAFLRLAWSLLQPARGVAGMPPGWIHGRLPEIAFIPGRGDADSVTVTALMLPDQRAGESAGAWLELARQRAEAESIPGLRTLLLEDVERVHSLLDFTDTTPGPGD